METPSARDVREYCKVSGIEVTALSPALGAEIRGVDLRTPVSESAFAAVRAAWLTHCVLLFRGQCLSDADIVAFSRRFGGLDLPPNMESGRKDVAEQPEIFVISNVVEDGRAIGSLGHGETKWHTDMAYTDVPPKASTLYALEVPEEGGDTGFANMYMAYDALPDALRRQVDRLSLKHDPGHTIEGRLRDGLDASEFADVAAAPGPVHPLVRTNPDSGRKALYLGRRHRGYIPGLAPAESDALLDRLWTHAIRDELIWFHKWRVGDYVMWDNRCVMHYRRPFSANARRIMHRTQIRDVQRPA